MGLLYFRKNFGITPPQHATKSVDLAWASLWRRDYPMSFPGVNVFLGVYDSIG